MLVRAKTSFCSTALGYDVIIDPSVIVDDASPHVKTYPQLFEPVRASRGFEIEEATARPGEGRNVRR